MGIGNNPKAANPCSPGAYDEYVTGSDGARSNDVYIPIIGPSNTWAGYNSTDEFQADFAGQTTCKYKLADGSLDGVCLPIAGMIEVVDGNNLVTGYPGSVSYGVYDVGTGAVIGQGNETNGNAGTMAAKNGIVGWAQSANQLDSFAMEETANNNPFVDVPNVGTSPGPFAMSTGCNTNPNAATAFSYDQEGTTLYRVDAVGSPSDGTYGSGTVTASKIGSVALSGFAPASQLASFLAPRLIAAWDSNCMAVVLAPVVTGTNPNDTMAYSMELALADMTTGNMRQLGTYVSTGIPSTAIAMAADPSGNDVVISSTDQNTGTTILTEVSWTLDANENPTFTETTLTAAPPVGVYGVSLGILPGTLVPNGTTVRVGQREQHYAFTEQ
jgi:hypothetical protein